MTVILLKLIAAHLIGDFLLQWDRLCAMKFDSALRGRIKALCIHSGIQAMLSYLFVGEWTLWLLPAVIFVCHFMIDYIKVMTGRKDLPVLLLDQLAHYAVIFLVWWFMFVKGHCSSTAATSLLSYTFWLIVTGYIAVLTPTSILIKSFMEYEKWMPEGAYAPGLPNAGKWIGYLERVLILTFIFTDNVEGIGFLLAAKSVFRFGELSRARDVKITEYVVIGTFASFTIAILLGFVIQWLGSFGCEAVLR